MLEGIVWEVKELFEFQIKEMYNLMMRYYDGINYNTFIKDLKEKEWVILFNDNDGKIKGFTTIMLMQDKIDREEVYAIFSGDTIIDKDYWGKHNLYRVWSEFAFQLSFKYKNLYWLLISKGYKTYMMLPRFFKEFYPVYNKKIPSNIKKIMNTFAFKKYPLNYNIEKGIISFKGETERLKEHCAEIPEEKLKDPHVNFFLESNPNYKQGDELVCLARIDKENLEVR